MDVHASPLTFGLQILKKEKEKEIPKVCENKVGKSGIEKSFQEPRARH